MSQIKDHISKYGSYGIGLTQAWGRSKGLNPVLYVDKKSTVGSNYRLAFDEIIKGKNVKTISEHDARLIDVIRYMKNYEADLVRRDGSITPNYRFADEKEWRYVPTKEQCQILFNNRGYQKQSFVDKMNADAALITLDFDPEDIKYIIIKDDSEVLEFLNLLYSVKGKYSHNDVQRLTTRLITAEQIKSDF